MVEILRKRLAGREEGFTLIELLVVIVILGILLAIAVPSYMGFRERAQVAAAKSNIRAAVPSAEAYFQDHDAYTGMTKALLQVIDPSIKVSVGSAAATTYCIYNLSPTTPVWHKNGPAGDVATGACS